KVPTLDGIDPDAAKGVVATSLAAGAGWMDPPAALRLLACYGITPAESRVVATPREAARAAAELGGPVVLKAIAPGLLHKTVAGAVILGLRGRSAVLKAATEIGEKLGGSGFTPTGYLVQRLAPAGVEMLVGVVNDPSFGPV